jgi:hypothetical protein
MWPLGLLFKNLLSKKDSMLVVTVNKDQAELQTRNAGFFSSKKDTTGFFFLAVT